MSSRIEQATVALAALLAGIPDTTVERNRDIPADFRAEAQHLILTDGDDAEGSPAFVGGNIVEFAAGVEIAGYVTHSNRAQLGPLRDALWLATWRLVTANPRLTSSGVEVTWDVRPGATRRRIDEANGKPVAVFELPVLLMVKAEASDPAVAA